MLISRSCSWCDQMNFATTRFCEKCGHSASLPRFCCDCPRCATARRRAASTAPLVPLPAILAAALAALRARASAPDRPVDGPSNVEGRNAMSAKHENSPDPAPVTREVSQTPASPARAAAIRQMDAELVAAHGHDFAYAVLAAGSLVAASSAVHGYVPPVVTDTAAGPPDSVRGTADDE